MNRIQWRRKQQAKRQADKNRRRRRLHKQLYEVSKTVRYSAMYSRQPTFQMARGVGDLVAENLRAAFKAPTRGNPHVELAVKMFNIKDRHRFEIDILTKKKRKEFYDKPNKLREELRMLASSTMSAFERGVAAHDSIAVEWTNQACQNDITKIAEALRHSGQISMVSGLTISDMDVWKADHPGPKCAYIDDGE